MFDALFSILYIIQRANFHSGVDHRVVRTFLDPKGLRDWFFWNYRPYLNYCDNAPLRITVEVIGASLMKFILNN